MRSLWFTLFIAVVASGLSCRLKIHGRTPLETAPTTATTASSRPAAAAPRVVASAATVGQSATRLALAVDDDEAVIERVLGSEPFSTAALDELAKQRATDRLRAFGAAASGAWTTRLARGAWAHQLATIDGCNPLLVAVEPSDAKLRVVLVTAAPAPPAVRGSAVSVGGFARLNVTRCGGGTTSVLVGVTLLEGPAFATVLVATNQR